MSTSEQMLITSNGMVTDINPLVSDGIRFELIENLYPEGGSLVAEPYLVPYAEKRTPDGVVDGYVYAANPVQKKNYFLIKIDNKMYNLASALSPEIDESTTNLTKLDEVCTLYKDTYGEYTEEEEKEPFRELDSTSILQHGQWIWGNVNTSFFTKPGLPLHKLDEKPNEVADTGVELVPPYRNDSGKDVYLSAKYLLVTTDRLFLANCYEGSTLYPTRIHWSNINNPLEWNIESTSEADYFDLGVNALDITGLGYSMSVILIFTRNSIWRADYENFDTKFRTTKFTSNTGCLYHYSVISVNEVVYFIGKDNFYAIDNLTITPIGNDIWKWFKENANLTPEDNVVAQYEAEQNSITWLFKRKIGNGTETWGIKYNIELQAWSLRKF